MKWQTQGSYLKINDCGAGPRDWRPPTWNAEAFGPHPARIRGEAWFEPPLCGALRGRKSSADQHPERDCSGGRCQRRFANQHGKWVHCFSRPRQRGARSDFDAAHASTPALETSDRCNQCPTLADCTPILRTPQQNNSLARNPRPSWLSSV